MHKIKLFKKKLNKNNNNFIKRKSLNLKKKVRLSKFGGKKKHGYSVMFCFIKTIGGCPQCPSLLLYVLYQNITIECWPACLYPSNKGDFLSVCVCDFSTKIT